MATSESITETWLIEMKRRYAINYAIEADAWTELPKLDPWTLRRRAQRTQTLTVPDRASLPPWPSRLATMPLLEFQTRDATLDPEAPPHP